MGKFVLIYTGGSMPETAEAQEATMAAWGAWLGSLGAAALDGGNPFGASTAVKADGSQGATGTGAGGYSVLSADSLQAAVALTSGCPILAVGGTVEVFEAIEM